MKKLLLLSAVFSAASFAATFDGTIMDGMCASAKKDPATHTAKCSMACSKSGYGLMTADGKYIKFDEAGNAKALAALKDTAKKDDLKATVSGTMDGDTLKVDSVKVD
ncbi:hypothetical protein [Nevskia soli]|jgi:hypothetical protein|uniref:hypothetical protein n=1 Tax=Nevskia soli TaxID=418856 RepID=UPI0015D8C1EE|nr:hypothetical protein [Nevskia soli]